MTGYALFATAWFLAAAAPGADTALLVSKSIASGWRSTAPYALGIALAKVTMLTAAYFGLAAALSAAPWLLIALKVFGAGFLLWRAWRLWRSASFVAGQSKDGFWSGFSTAYFVGASNPQALMFYIAVVPQVVAETNILVLDAIVFIGFIAISAVYAALALPIRRMLEKKNATQVVNRIVAAVFVILSAIIIAR